MEAKASKVRYYDYKGERYKIPLEITTQYGDTPIYPDYCIEDLNNRHLIKTVVRVKDVKGNHWYIPVNETRDYDFTKIDAKGTIRVEKPYAVERGILEEDLRIFYLKAHQTFLMFHINDEPGQSLDGGYLYYKDTENPTLSEEDRLRALTTIYRK